MHVLTYKVVRDHHHIITRVSLLLYFGYQDNNMTLGVKVFNILVTGFSLSSDALWDDAQPLYSIATI